MIENLSGEQLKENVFPRNVWRLGDLLGSGACAKVYEAFPAKEDPKDIKQYVAKVSQLPNSQAVPKGKKRNAEHMNADVLNAEHMLYRNFLKGHPQIPTMPLNGGFGDDLAHSLRFLIIQRLGPDLKVLLDRYNGAGMPLAEVQNYGRQMLNALRILHERHKVIFVDLKPENFMLGLPGTEDADKVFMADFGLARRLIGHGGVHRPFINGNIEGTPDYLSVSCHGGGSPGRRDDLESLGYVLLYLLGGANRPLPWSTARSDKEGLDLKLKANLDSLCTPAPGLKDWITLARSTPYEGVPDYQKFSAILDSMIKPMHGHIHETGTSAENTKKGRENFRVSRKKKPRIVSKKRMKNSPDERGEDSTTPKKRILPISNVATENVKEPVLCRYNLRSRR